MLRKYRKYLAVSIVLSIMTLLTACSNSGMPEHDASYYKQLVINEVMANNLTGLTDSDGRLQGWVELKNIGEDTLQLSDYKLGTNLYLPDTMLLPGSCFLVMESEQLKLPKRDGHLQLFNPLGSLSCEVRYDHLKADQSLSRQDDSTYVKTYMPTPGFENTNAGYEAYQALIDKQRKSSPLLIWELMSRAEKTSQNWVELKNVSDSSISLKDYRLANKFNKKKGCQLPDIKLAAGSYIVFQTAGSKANKFNHLHLNFKMGEHESVVLMKGNKFVDAVSGRGSYNGISVGRMEGKSGFFYLAKQTKGAENNGEAKRFVAHAPTFDKNPGIYNRGTALTVNMNGDGHPIRYTLNGGQPNSSSAILREPLKLNKSSVVRAYCEGDSVTLRSRTAMGSYIMDEKHDLAVFNITVSNYDLYDYYNGIYSDGPGYTEEWPHMGANYWLMRKRPAHIEFYDGKNGFSEDCQLKIFGGYSRLEAKKSFCVKFCNNLGKAHLKYDFFDEGEEIEMNDLVLRSGSQDWNRCMIRDEFFTSLMAPECPELLIQKYRPVALYINMEYFGLYYLREKIDDHFVSRKLGVSDDSTSIIMSKYLEHGSRTDYDLILRHVTNKDIRQKENYDWVKEKLDVQGLIDWKLGEIYSSNTDVGNIRYVRSTDERGDRKWHFVFYDLDATWLGYEPAAFYIRTGGKAAELDVEAHNKLINRLLDNPDFRQLFIKRLKHHMNKTFTPENTIKVFDELVKSIRPEMERNCQRWPQLQFKTWEKNIADFRAKFETRSEVMLKDLRRELRITDEEWK